MSDQKTRGFTLVELLVVIAIIGVLVALLVPAVNAARELARKGQCANNLRNLGQAAISHESDIGFYPGRVNYVRAYSGGYIAVSWVGKLLPNIEQNNLWDTILNDLPGADPRNNGITTMPGGLPGKNAISSTLMSCNVRTLPVVLDTLASPPNDTNRIAWFTTNLEVTVCPSDPAISLIPARLSYVINAGAWDLSWASYVNNGQRFQEFVDAERRNGVSHVIAPESTTGKVDSGYVSKNDGTTSTLLLSENVNAISWPMLEEGATTMVWTPYERWLPLDEKGQQYAINKGHEQLLDDQLLEFARNNPQELLKYARPSSNHSGGVNAVFCDGHATYLSDDIDTWVYAQLLSVSNPRATHPFTGVGQQVPVQMVPPAN
jgi:prepilin-type N-terminal cleavage/methylation domain-containing protein/prepilin-type processing-associated H-X9-DG protein